MTRNYAYGARAPIGNRERATQQLSLANSYQRALVMIERKRRAVVDRLYRRACPAEYEEYEAADAAVFDAARAVNLTRSTGGDILEADEEMKAKRREETQLARRMLIAARERKAAAALALKKARKEATPKLKPRLAMCDRGARARNKLAYNLASTVGLAWGTRLKVAESVERAAKMAAKLGTLPHLPRWDAGGMIAVQIQNGMASAVALGGDDTRLKIEVVDRQRWLARQGCDGRTGRTGKPMPQPRPGSHASTIRDRAFVSLRIGTREDRSPIWATWPVTMHRPLPATASIKWALMHARRIGPRTEWQFIVTVDDVPVPIREHTNTLAVNLGWRYLPDGGLRVAYAVGSDGHEEEVRVPPDFIAGMQHAESIQAIRKRIFNTEIASLREWLDEGERPGWIMDESRYMDRWLAPRKLVRLLREWRSQRFDGDAAMFAVLEKWAAKDRHLWFWECDERLKLIRSRQDFYRTVAARWATKYSRIIVGAIDLRAFATSPDPEEGKASDGTIQRRSRTLAAPSVLRAAVKNASETRGSDYAERPSVYKTQTCNACGLVFEFAAKEDVVHVCECGAKWDQDANHDRNLLTSDKVMRAQARPLAATGNSSDQVIGQAPKGRWANRRSQSTQQTPSKSVANE